MLKSHFYKGARILVKGDEVRLEIRDWSNLSGPLHEMEFVLLMNLLGATYNFRMKCTLNGREAVAYELMEEIRMVMNDKYHTVWGIVDEEGHGRMMQLQVVMALVILRRTKRRIPGSICGIIRDIRHLHLRSCMSGTRVSGRDIQI